MMASTTELKALEDINALLTTGMLSDVTLVVGKKTAAAHKLILSARSPVFAALFVELPNAENRVEIDVEAGVLEHFLAFIYTGKVPALEPKMAEYLLAAAEKYKLEQLKSITEDYLFGQLSFESVASLLPFAEAVNASKLKDKCLELTNSLALITRPVAPLPPVARLHDPCLVALFRQLPPVDQITARTVCRRWADLVPYAARSTRSLAIIVNRHCSLVPAEYQLNRLSYGPDWELLELLRKEDGTPLHRMHSFSKWNSLQFNKLDEATVTAITATFPVLKELQLSAQLNRDNLHCDCCITTTPPLDHLVRLLEHWRLQLTTLKLDVSITSIFTVVRRESIDRLGAAISSLAALKHLAFELQWNRHSHCPSLSSILLPQLSQLTINSDPFQFVDMLRQCGRPLKSDTPLQISYDCADYEWDSFIPQVTSLNEDLRRCFVRLDDGYSPDYRTVCRHFPSLTSVNLFLSEATFRDLLTHVSQLTQLVHLKLDIDFEDIRPDNQPSHLLPQLKSVKLLHLEINNLKSHTDLEQLNLAWTMPNVQVIDFKINPLRCTTCGVFNRSTPNMKRKHCLRQMFAPLKRHCAQLHTIMHNLGKSLGTAEELLAEPITEAASPSMDTSTEHQAANSD